MKKLCDYMESDFLELVRKSVMQKVKLKKMKIAW